MRVVKLLWVVLAIGAGACGDEEASAVEPTCSYDFSAHVRSGPNAGLVLAGNLVLVETGPDGAIGGHLAAPDVASEADLVAVTGRVADGTISLDFELAEGHVVGSGPFAGEFADCAEPLEGGLTGPGEGDVGDWDAVQVLVQFEVCVANQYTNCRNTKGVLECAARATAFCTADALL